MFKNTPTMKKWGIISWTAVIALTGALLYGTFFTQIDMSNLIPVVSLAWGEVATYHIVYGFKEKAANKLKISYDFIEKCADKYGIESITPILQSVISE